MEKKYPLEQLMRIKKSRYDQAIIELEKRREELTKEEKTLRTLQEARDEVLQHKQDKMQQLRKELDEGTTTDKILQRKNYLTVVEEKLMEEEKKVSQQESVVKKKEEEVVEAKNLVFSREKDVEKLREHKKRWKIDAKYALSRQEEKEHDELGSAAHTLKKIEKRRDSS